MVCSSGFYVRSLAHDLGQRLGCGAHLDGLRRTRAGTFGDADAVPLDTIVREGPLTIQRLIPLEHLLPELPSVVLSDEGVKRVSPTRFEMRRSDFTPNRNLAILILRPLPKQ